MGKKLPSQPEDTTKCGTQGGSYMKGKEIHPGAKKRQDGKNHKGGANSKDGLWDAQDSEQKGENFPGA